MRNLSVVAAVVVVLLNSSCAPCSGGEPVNAFKLLNDYLADHAKSSDLAMNIEAAKKYLSEPEKDPEVVELIELLVKIDPNEKLDSEEACKAESIANKWNFVKALEKHEPEDFEAKEERLADLVENFNPSPSVCFRLFEAKWLKDQTRIEEELNNIEHLKDQIEFSDATNKPEDCKLPECRTETQLLLNSLDKHAKDFKLEFEVPTAEEWATSPALSATFEADDKKIKKGLVEKPERFTEDRIKAVFEMTTFEPCRKFVEHKESKAILEPVGQLADLTESDLDGIQPIEGNKISTFKWASRYYHCKLILKTGLEEYSKLMLNYFGLTKEPPSVKAVDAPTKGSWFGNLFGLGSYFGRSAEQPTASEHAAEEVNEQSTNVA